MLKSYYQKKLVEVGCDEVGRGCTAGPVVAAAVIFKKDYKNNNIIDSKKISKRKRLELANIIKIEAENWAIASVNNLEIDKMNILNASFYAMHKAIDKLKVKPEFIIVDGNKFISYKNLDYECIVKGDNKFLSIAAASILAKTFRDDFMIKLSKKYTNYSWESNYGYPTKAHKDGIKKYGLTKYHRKSFKAI